MAKPKIKYPMVVLVEGVLMGNGEFIHYGRTLGWANKKQIKLVEAGATKLSRGSEVVIALYDQVA
jgi:hypothetical protein